jgi:hypothetical protein
MKFVCLCGSTTHRALDMLGNPCCPNLDEMVTVSSYEILTSSDREPEKPGCCGGQHGPDENCFIFGYGTSISTLSSLSEPLTS